MGEVGDFHHRLTEFGAEKRGRNILLVIYRLTVT